MHEGMFEEIDVAAEAIAGRLSFNELHERTDITDYAVVARDIAIGLYQPDALRSMLSDEEAAQIETQLTSEQNFPAGVRIGTFVHSPVRTIIAFKCQKKSPVPVTKADILTWLRCKTGWPVDLDELIDRATGVRLPVLAGELAKLHRKDPVSFYLLMSFEFSHLSLDVSITYPPSEKMRGEHQWPFHTKATLIDVMMQIAEWCRAIAIADYLFEREDAHHLALRDFAKGRLTGVRPSDHIFTIIDSMPLSVPMLRACLDGSKALSRADIMAEFERIAMPSLKHGNGTKRPLYHFYGLGPIDVLMVAFLDILSTRRAIAPSSDAVNGPHVRRPNLGQFGQGPLEDVIQGTLTSRWAKRNNIIKQDAALRAKILRRRYARTSKVAGSAYRFDLEFWAQTERDAGLFQRLATRQNRNLDTHSFPDRVAQVRNTLLNIMPIVMDHGQISFGSRVVAHMMTATTVLTVIPCLWGC